MTCIVRINFNTESKCTTNTILSLFTHSVCDENVKNSFENYSALIVTLAEMRRGETHVEYYGVREREID